MEKPARQGERNPTMDDQPTQSQGEATRGEHPTGYFDLMEAFAQPGCALCRLALAASERYLDNWRYETFTDVGNRAALVRAGGFCTLHTWSLAQRQAAFALAVAYRSILLDRLDKLEPRPGVDGGMLRGLFGRRGGSGGRRDDGDADERAAARLRTCPACRVRDETTRRYVAAFAESAADATFLEVFARSSGLCLIHWGSVRAACAAHQGTEALDGVVERQRACLQRTLVDVEEMIRKHDYRFRDEPRGDEMRSWELAAELVAGRRGVW